MGGIRITFRIHYVRCSDYFTITPWDSIPTPVGEFERVLASGIARVLASGIARALVMSLNNFARCFHLPWNLRDLVCIETYPGELPSDQARASVDDTANTANSVRRHLSGFRNQNDDAVVDRGHECARRVHVDYRRAAGCMVIL